MRNAGAVLVALGAMMAESKYLWVPLVVMAIGALLVVMNKEGEQ